VDAFLRSTIRVDRTNIEVIPMIKPGSDSLARVYAHGKSIAIANDTSFGVGFAPYSALERHVLDAAATLRSAAFHEAFPAAGDDFKIMGLRQQQQWRFTVALALVDRHVSSIAHYAETKAAISAHLASKLPAGSVVALNCLDPVDAKDESGLHLTVTGLSAEMGDDGQVGRGNRVNGLITPGRPMSLEAAAGKNPVSHVGKIYNVLAHAMAHDIARQVDGLAQVDVQLLSTIGRPIDQPQVVLVEAGPAAALTVACRGAIEKVVNSWLDRIESVTTQLAQGQLAVY
jgi:S-adenosylmethionine synthetase